MRNLRADLEKSAVSKLLSYVALYQNSAFKGFHIVFISLELVSFPLWTRLHSRAASHLYRLYLHPPIYEFLSKGVQYTARYETVLLDRRLCYLIPSNWHILI